MNMANKENGKAITTSRYDKKTRNFSMNLGGSEKSKKLMPGLNLILAKVFPMCLKFCLCVHNVCVYCADWHRSVKFS